MQRKISNIDDFVDNFIWFYKIFYLTFSFKLLRAKNQTVRAYLILQDRTKNHTKSRRLRNAQVNCCIEFSQDLANMEYLQTSLKKICYFGKIVQECWGTVRYNISERTFLSDFIGFKILCLISRSMCIILRSL